MVSSAAGDIPPFLEHFPLRVVPTDILENLCKALLGWRDCPMCSNQGACRTGVCQWSRKIYLVSYLPYYRRITARSTPEDWSQSQQALRSHDDLLGIIRLIENNPDVSRAPLLQQYFAKYASQQPSRWDQNRAFDLAFEAITMIPCSERNFHMDTEPFAPWVTWRDRQTASDLLRAVIRKGKPLRSSIRSLILRKVSAATLEEYDIKIVPTQDFRKHLFLETKRRRVHVFHHLGFLKARLVARKEGKTTNSEIIPRDLAIETMYSLHFILFQRTDLASREIAANIGCDLHSLVIDLHAFIEEEGDDCASYPYWGARLVTLLELIDASNQGTTSWRKSKWRCFNKLLAVFTMLAVVVAIIGVVYQARGNDSAETTSDKPPQVYTSTVLM